ncbi:unnamed protein product, partial [Heligmosomoides polygyrus]|uniref:Uncharacterized protein n=1 Tax=Heligmosomoides polygyrus TaxID=6339 RepID=A0A183F5W7_HELPZ
MLPYRFHRAARSIWEQIIRRRSGLGNTVAGTPFEHPDRMASHATGFALPTIRRCSERVDVVPHCTYRPGSVPTVRLLTSALGRAAQSQGTGRNLTLRSAVTQYLCRFGVHATAGGFFDCEEELSSLSRTFADEPWYPSLKDKSRAPPPRKKTKKRPTPSPASLSEMEVRHTIFDSFYRRVEKFTYDDKRFKDVFDNDCGNLDDKEKTRLLI